MLNTAFGYLSQVGVDLLEGMSSYVSKDEADPTAHPAPIKPVLDALLHFQPDRSSKQTAHFVTFRNNMNKIMGVRAHLVSFCYYPLRGWLAHCVLDHFCCSWLCRRRTTPRTSGHSFLRSAMDACTWTCGEHNRR